MKAARKRIVMPDPLTIWPVYEFRPDHVASGRQWLRYADGAWIPDDGEFDVCFITDGFGAPLCAYFDPLYQRNMVAKWLTTHWSAHVHAHPHGNAWHHALRDGETEWGGDWGHDRHPNYVVSRKGMDRLVSVHHCANGVGVTMDFCDRTIAAGLLRERETKRVFSFPPVVCMYCGSTGPTP